MLAAARAQKLTPVISPLLPRKPIVLLVGDQPERLLRMRNSLGVEQIEFVVVSTLSDLPQRSGQHYALAIVDFDAAQLSQALAILRASKQTHAIPVLVEASRLNDPLRIAGVLPQHRAMACAWHDLLALAQQQLQAPRQTTGSLRGML
jgi:CheY-like chemotaxis protein